MIFFISEAKIMELILKQYFQFFKSKVSGSTLPMHTIKPLFYHFQQQHAGPSPNRIVI